VPSACPLFYLSILMIAHLFFCCLQGPPGLWTSLCSSCCMQQHEVKVLQAHAVQRQLYCIQGLLVGLCCNCPGRRGNLQGTPDSNPVKADRTVLISEIPMWCSGDLRVPGAAYRHMQLSQLPQLCRWILDWCRLRALQQHRQQLVLINAYR
jgi:hypothetical protein